MLRSRARMARWQIRQSAGARPAFISRERISPEAAGRSARQSPPHRTASRMAVAEGRLQIRDWTDREGGKRRSAEVVADNVYFGDSKRDSGSEYGGSSYGAPSAYGAPPAGGAPAGGRASASGFGGGSDFAEIGEEDGELPF